MLAGLRSAGIVGSVKGILEKLDEIEQRTPACARFTSELRTLVKRFRLDAYVKRLTQAGEQLHEQPGA